MSGLNYFAAATILALPLVLPSTPADAFTARQQSLQGYGIYTTSKGYPAGFGGGYYLPPPPPPGIYGYGYGYRPFGYWRRRYPYGY